jgi:hypothetical protein
MYERKSERICDGNIKKPRTLYGSIYFKTNLSILSSDDYIVLDELIGFCGVLLIYSKVALFFDGRADIRGPEINNKKLSEDRANTVRAYVDKALRESCNYISFSMGYGEKKSGMDFSEDRRVDIFITQILKKEKKSTSRIKESDFEKPLYVPGTTYPFQEICDNLDKSKPFTLKYYHPDYDKLWKPLQDLIDTIEKLFTINRPESISQFVRPEHIDYIIKLVDHYYPKYEGFEIGVPLNDLKFNPPKEVWGMCFRIIYSIEYDKADRAAENDWLYNSDYKHYCEWWGNKLRLAPPNTPYAKRSSR